MPELFELLGCGKPVIVAAQTAISGSDPKDAIFIFQQAADNITGNCCGIIGKMAKTGKVTPVITVQAVVRAQPDKTPLVLQDTIDLVVRQTILCGQPVKI